jgi:hypothetical protein
MLRMVNNFELLHDIQTGVFELVIQNPLLIDRIGILDKSKSIQENLRLHKDGIVYLFTAHHHEAVFMLQQIGTYATTHASPAFMIGCFSSDGEQLEYLENVCPVPGFKGLFLSVSNGKVVAYTHHVDKIEKIIQKLNSAEESNRC